MTIVTSEQKSTFAEALRLHGLPSEDFALTETHAPVALTSDLTAGWITIRRLSNENARTYSIGARHDWTGSFTRDLRAGVYGR